MATQKSTIVIANLQTKEPFFQSWEVEVWDSTRTTMIASEQLASATYDAATETWTQGALIHFRGLVTGTVYSFRARVHSKATNIPSDWSPWANETAGDVTPPSTTTFTPVGATRGRGGIIVIPTVANVPDDHDYLLWWPVVQAAGGAAPAAPAATDRGQNPNMVERFDRVAHTLTTSFFVPLSDTEEVWLWVRDVDTSGNLQDWQALGVFRMPTSNVTIPAVTQNGFVDGKTQKVKVNLTCTTPNDPTFAGLRIYVTNEKNDGQTTLKLSIPGPLALLTGVSAQFVTDNDTLFGSHSVTITFVSVSIAGVEGSLAGSPTVVLPNGFDGTYTGPATPSPVTVVNAGNNLFVTWPDTTDTEVVEFWPVRVRDGTHNAPGGSKVLVSIVDNFDGTYSLTTSTAHGLSTGDGFFVHNATGMTWINGYKTVLSIDSSTAFRISGGPPITYTANSGRLWKADKFVRPHVLGDGWQPLASFLDKFFNPGEYDPANPERFIYFVAARTAHALTSGYAQSNTIELIPDPAAVNQPDPLASVLNRLFNSAFVSNTAGVNVNLTEENSSPPTNPDLNGQGTPPTGFGPWYAQYPQVTSLTPGNPAQFTSDGSGGTGEVMFQPLNNTYFIAVSEVDQYDSSTKFSPGVTLTLSVWARTTNASLQNYNLGMGIVRFHAGSPTTDIFTFRFNASLLSTVYQRFQFSCQLSTANWANSAGDFLQISFAIIPTASSNTPNVLIIKPMLNEGLTAANWTPVMDTTDTPGAARIGITVRPVTTPTPPAHIHRDASAPAWGT